MAGRNLGPTLGITRGKTPGGILGICLCWWLDFSCCLLPDPALAFEGKSPASPAAGKQAAEKPAAEQPASRDGRSGTNSDADSTSDSTPESTATDPPAESNAAKQESESQPDPKLREKLKNSLKKVASEQTYDLRYKLKPGEEIRWKVEHLVTHETSIKETRQTAKSRSISTKVWKIRQIDDQGRFVLEYSVDDVDMWQHVSGRPEVTYNSRSDDTPPREYASVANMVGVPLALVTVDEHGSVIDKTYPTPGASPSVAELAVPLPAQPVKVGAHWHWPEEVNLKLEDNRVVRVRLRHVYTLQSVDKNMATIAIRTDMLTPLDDPKIHGRLLERLKKGTAKFDLESGRFTFAQLDLDETVVGFAGGDSLLEYRARFVEEIIVGPSQPSVEPRRAASRTEPGVSSRKQK